MNMTQQQTSEFETEVLAKLLEGDLPELELLRSQVRSARVRREWTGAGFWTEFTVDPSTPRLANRGRFQITGVYGRHPDLDAGVGFTLFVDDGAVSSLEGYTYEEPWPANLQVIKLEQEPAGQRRVAEITKLLRPGKRKP
jgi:hypothetical protein